MFVSVAVVCALVAHARGVARSHSCERYSRSYGMMQTKFPASSALPLPLYFALCG
jgi:hypothetical protein